MYKSNANPNKKKRIAGYKEKTGELHKSEKDFYANKKKKAADKASKTFYKTKDGKVFKTEKEFYEYTKKRG